MFRKMPAFAALGLLGFGLPAMAQLHLNDRDYLESQGLNMTGPVVDELRTWEETW